MSIKSGTKTSMPCPKSMLKSIALLNETTNMLWMIRIQKARSLSHANFLIENAMKKSILHI
jgi:hypothetical protein